MRSPRHYARQGSGIVPALRDGLGLIVSLAQGVDTDALGTFTGEIARAGSIREAAISKARLGMTMTKTPIGIASEGSYGPHPVIPFVAVGIELMVLVDDTRDIIITEHLVENAPVYGHTQAKSIDELGAFLERVRFPDHALIVKPNVAISPSFPIHKGVHSVQCLADAIAECAASSPDGQAFIQNDIRAHMNPTRMASISRLAQKLRARLETPCPACNLPGYGRIDVETGLPCEWCGTPSMLVRYEIFGCVACSHREHRARPDGRHHADPGNCPRCNP